MPQMYCVSFFDGSGASNNRRCVPPSRVHKPPNVPPLSTSLLLSGRDHIEHLGDMLLLSWQIMLVHTKESDLESSVPECLCCFDVKDEKADKAEKRECRRDAQCDT